VVVQNKSETLAINLSCVHANDGNAPVITNDTFWKTTVSTNHPTSGSYIYSQGGGIFRFPY
jgi:hypothetical protein